MKKSILTIVLAVMMLVAFTACEQQVPQIPSDNHVLSGIQYVSGPLTYYQGDKFDASAYEVQLVYKDNISPVTANGSLYLEQPTSWPTIGAELADSSTYTVTNTIDDTGFKVTVYSRYIELDITNAVTEVAEATEPDDAISTEGLVATLVSGDGTKEAYDLSKIDVAYAGKDKAATVTNDDGYAIKYVKDGASVKEWTITKAAEVGEVENLVVKYYVGDSTTSVSSVADSTYNWGENVTVKYVLVDAANKEVGTVKASALKVLGTGTVSDSYKISDKTQTASFYYIAANGKAIQGTVTIGIGNNYGTGITEIGLSETGKAGITIPTDSSSVTIDKDYFAAKVTQAFGDPIACTEIEVIDAITVNKDTKAGNYPCIVQFGYTDAEGNPQYKVDTVNITVKAASSES